MKRNNTFVARLAPLLAAWLAHPVYAQSSPQAARPDPLQADAPVPAAVYQSPFSQYRPFTDEKLMSWKETHDTVGRIGGWRVYAKEAREPEATVAPTPSAAPAAPDAIKPMPDHKMK